MSTPSTTPDEPHDTQSAHSTTSLARDGVFSIIAMDQRNTLRRMFSAVGIVATDDDLVKAKTDVARALTPLASGILFDPTYGVPAVTGTGALRRYCGLLVASEPPERGSLQRRAAHPPRPRPGRAVGARRRAATPTSSSPSCAPTARPRRGGEPDLVAECLQAVRQVVDGLPRGRRPFGDREPRVPASRARTSRATAVRTRSSRRRAHSTKSTSTY